MKLSTKKQTSASRYRLGTLMVSRNAISRAQLHVALAYQKNHPDIPLGQILIEQESISRKKLTRCLGWQKRLRSTALILNLIAAPFQTAWADTSVSTPSLGFNWTASCQDSICMSQNATVTGAKNAPPTLVLELKPNKLLRALGIIDHADEAEGKAPPGERENQLRYHIGLSPGGVAVGWQFRF